MAEQKAEPDPDPGPTPPLAAQPRPGVISIAAALLAAAPARALAQEFVKVEGKLADNVPAVPFVGIAYGVIWLAVLVYVVSVARGLGRVNARDRRAAPQD